MRLHPEEVPPDIGMLDDRNGPRIGTLHFPHRSALDPLLRIGNGVFERRGGVAQALHADVETGAIHHVEHDFHPLPLLAEEFADAFSLVAEIERAGGRSFDSHLVLDIARMDIICLSDAAVGVHAVLGNNKNGDASRSRRISFDPRQDRVDDVFRQIMIPAGDEALRPRDAEVPVGQPLRRRLQGPDIAPCAGLGQTHRSRPLTGKHFVHVFILQFLRPEMADQGGRPVGESRIHQQGKIGGVEMFLVGRKQDDRHSLPAYVRRFGGAEPSPLDVLLEGIMITFRYGDFPVFEGASLLVPCGIGRKDHIESHLLRFREHHHGVVLREILERFRLKQLLDTQLFKKKELLISRIHK